MNYARQTADGDQAGGGASDMGEGMVKLRNSIFAAALVAVSFQVFAQSALPSRPIRLIVGAPPGGANDTVARIVVQRMNLGQPVIVENKNGASSMIAADYVAKAPADGSVLLLASQTVIAVAPVINKITSFDPLKDFTGVALIGSAPLVLVAGPSLQARNVKELIAEARAKPDEIDFGNGGVGTSPHMAGVLFALTSGTKLRSIPYPGEQAAMTDIMAGRIHMMFANAGSGFPHVRSGRLRALAVTSAQRSDIAPDVPTVAETLPGYEAGTWLGILAPAATPKATIAQLNAEVLRVLALPEVKDKLKAQGFALAQDTPEEFSQFIRAEHAKWGKLIKDANIKPD